MNPCAEATRATATSRSWPGRVFALATPLLLLPFAAAGLPAQATMADGSAGYVVGSPGAGRFPLAANGQVATLRLDEGEWPGVIRAANDLKADFGRVTRAEPAVVVGGQPAAAGQLVLIGTIGKSATIDRLISEGKIDGKALAGKWETFVTQAVSNPLPGVQRALVVAGSDKRGTIYGIYDISAQIGVSPWYWWADVPVPQQSSLYVLPGRHTQGTPAVKYRGIFINDEAPAMSGWTNATNGGFNSKLYTRMFELILRLKGNFLWPAMWGSAFNLDDPQNPILADEYGIVMSTSHHEPMQRAQQEWRRVGQGQWNYETNDSVLRAFWRDGIRNKGDKEGVVTLAMRGDGDAPMSREANTQLLERIVADQRKIIAEVTGKGVTATPQVWALYKEVQEYYDKGMRVPEDVTLLFADDNWGNIRRLPSPEDRNRTGGFGIYYHFDYVGGPRNSKWLNKNPIPRIWEQMNLAHEYGANQIWVVNVGDLKPMEYPIQFFLDYAWDPSRIPASRLPEYARLWAQQQFGASHAPEIADVVTTYLKYAGRRSAEMLDTVTFSLTNFREAERSVEDWRALEHEALGLARALPANYQDAYYQLVLHPVLAMANLADLYVTVAKNRLYATQGRAATNDLADRARQLFERDAQISAFYNDTLAGGKWTHMMDQTHIGYTYWQEPPRNTMPRVDAIQVRAPADMGVAVVEANRAVPPRRPGFPGGGLPGGGPRGMFGPPALPAFDPYLRQTYHLDVYNRGSTPFQFSAEAGQPWVTVSPAAGTVDKEVRLAVSVDWSRAPMGTDTVPINVTGPNDSRVVVQAPVSNSASPGRDFAGFVQSGNFVSMEAEHFTRAVGGNGVAWEVIPGFGKTLSGVHPTPVTAASQTPGGRAPHLQYRVFMTDTGTVRVHAYISPTWDFRGGSGLRYAVSIDDEAPQLVNIHADSSSTGRTDGNRAWEQGIINAIKINVSEHRLITPGEHVVKYWMVDPGIVLQKLVVVRGDLPETYLGPPESFRGPAAPATATGSRNAAGSASIASAAAAPARSPRATADPRFDWFRYEGRDSVYQVHKAGPGEYHNPILAGFYSDPSIVRVNDDYYLVTSTFAYFPGIPIFHSKDLVNWTQIGNVLNRRSQMELGTNPISNGVFAPAISHHDGLFYVINTLVGAGGNFFVTATNPAGPWSDPAMLAFEGIDPSFFFDDDGKAYVVNNGGPVGQPLYNGHRAIWIQEFDVATKQLVGPRAVIVNGGVDITKNPIWIEGPHLFKENGHYYLICAEGGTGSDHSEVVFRSDRPTGPYVPYQGNPILTQRHLDPNRPFPVTSTGHADFVETQNGEWWAVFLGTRPYGDDTYNTGRETFMMPVRWENGWPIVTSGNELVPYVHTVPNLPRQTRPAIPLSGNFTYQDDFAGPELARYWELIRTPREQWWDLTSEPGWLTVKARPFRLQDRRQPSFVGRRQQHIQASGSTAMKYRPAQAGDEAGIAAFQNDNFNYQMGVTLDGGQTVVRLVKHAGRNGPAGGEVVASSPLTLPASETVYLRIDARGGEYAFYYGTAPGDWTLLKDRVDGTVLSTKVAGGFVGTMLGMYAVSGG